MRNATWIISSLLVAGLVAGCARSAGTSEAGSQAPATSAAQHDEAATDANGGAQATKDYAYAQKDEFVDRFQSRLVELQGEMDHLSAQVDRASGKARADAEIALTTVREQLAQTKQHLAQARTATEADWDIVQGGVERSYDDLNDSVVRARGWLSEKLAP